MKKYKRINENLELNHTDKTFVIEVGAISNEIIGDAKNWEEVKTKTIYNLQYGDEYWCVNGVGTICSLMWKNDHYDTRQLEICNIYLTKEDAEFALFKLKLEAKMKKEFKPWECDWKEFEHKYSIDFAHEDGEVSVGSSYFIRKQGVIYCKDREDVEQFIEDNREDLIKYFKGE